jgi:hypothetical protein
MYFRKLARLSAVAAGLAFMFVPSKAEAVGFGIEVAGGFTTPAPNPYFQFTADLRQNLVSRLALGFRGGLGLTVNGGTTLNIPLDLYLNIFLASRFSLEAGGGLWIYPNTETTLRAHVGGGLNLRFGSLELAFHMGYLQPGLVALVRVGYFF